MKLSFTLSDHESKLLEEFEMHKCDHKDKSQMGMGTHVVFFRSDIGILKQVRCLCGKRKGITDIANLD